jgi:hypothetical protein
MAKQIKSRKRPASAKVMTKKTMKSTKGGGASLLQACCTGKHIPETTINP